MTAKILVNQKELELLKKVCEKYNTRVVNTKFLSGVASLMYAEIEYDYPSELFNTGMSFGLQTAKRTHNEVYAQR